MQRVDIFIGVLGLVAIVGSVVGVVTYEAAPTVRWDVTVATEETAVGEQVFERVATAAGVEGSWDQDEPNVTEVAFTLALASSVQARTAATTVHVTITAPNGQVAHENLTLAAAPATAASASATITMTVGQVPETASGQYATEDDALASVPTATNGTGTWDIVARITAGGAVPPETLTVRVTVDSYTRYTASAVVHTPDVSQGA